MNRALELHDSKLSRVLAEGDVCRVELRPAYVHESANHPGVSPGAGFAQDIDLVFRTLRATEIPSTLPSNISDGTLLISGVLTQNVIQLPLLESGTITFSIVTAEGQEMRIDADRVAAEVRGASKFIEIFPGDDHA